MSEARESKSNVCNLLLLIISDEVAFDKKVVQWLNFVKRSRK